MQKRLTLLVRLIRLAIVALLVANPGASRSRLLPGGSALLPRIVSDILLRDSGSPHEYPHRFFDKTIWFDHS